MEAVMAVVKWFFLGSFALSLLLIGVAEATAQSAQATAESKGSTFDREKLERTRALVASAGDRGAAEPVVMPGESPVSAVRMGQGLLFTVAVFLVGVHLYKRKAGARAGGVDRRIKVLERTAISSRCMVALIECDGRRMVIATGSDSVAFAPEGGSSAFDGVLAAQELNSPPQASTSHQTAIVLPLHRQITREVEGSSGTESPSEGR
jgi:flagellar biogenesis protein FliO